MCPKYCAREKVLPNSPISLNPNPNANLQPVCQRSLRGFMNAAMPELAETTRNGRIGGDGIPFPFFKVSQLEF